MSWTAIGILAGGVLLLGVLLFRGILWMVRRLDRKAMDAAVERFGKEAIRAWAPASFFGVQSEGPGQVRGNGLLILLDDELRFHQHVPSREVVVPLDRVREIDRATSHLGKQRFGLLLRVRFATPENDDGEEDVVAWHVPDLDGWIEALEEGRG